jgi:hypothetical protein
VKNQRPQKKSSPDLHTNRRQKSLICTSTKDKPEVSKTVKITITRATLIWTYVVILATVAIILNVGLWLRIPFIVQIETENLLLSSLAISILLLQFSKELSSHVKYVGYVMTGIFLGISLNQLLSVSYLVNLSFPSLFVDLSIVIFGLASIYLIAKKAKKPNERTSHWFLFERIRYVFLGVSLISLIFASYFFIYLIGNYLSVLSQAQTTGGTINADPSLFINIFKSLVLTGLFSFLERLLRLWEDTRSW